MNDRRLAELAALGSFDWIIEDPTNAERILDDTHAEYREEIEALRTEIAGERPADQVTFLLIDRRPWAYTELRRRGRRG